VITASDAAGPNTASIHGTKGYIEIEGTWCAPSAFRVLDSKKVLIEEFPRAEINGRGMHFQARELERLASVGERTSSVMPIAQSVAIMETMDVIRKQIGLAYPNDP
jgi:predicted dehydrogenase